jgi:HPt (histidine-containing phosphotransfer) domain-containing protein
MVSSANLGMSFAAHLFVRSSPGAIDTSNILSVCREGEVLHRALLREMLGYFINENQRRMATLAKAVDAGQRDVVRHTAHAVRGSAAMLGAGRLHDLAWSLEMDAEDPLSSLRSAVGILATEFEAVVASIYAAHPEAWTD